MTSQLNDNKRSKIRKFVVVLLCIPAIIFIYVTVALFIVHKAKGVEFSYENNGTDLSFSSSDGQWRAEEDMINGKDFKEILIDFELYRIRCNKQDVSLIRTKGKKGFWKWAWWFDNYSSVKWQVPYTSLKNIITDNLEVCHERDYTDEEISLANKRAKNFLQKLETNKPTTHGGE